MIIGIVKETFAGERRVAIVPSLVGSLMKKAQVEVLVESGAGDRAGFTDAEYTAAGANITADRAEVFAKSDIVCFVRVGGACGEAGEADLPHMRSGQVLVGHAEPLTDAAPNQKVAETGAKLFAMELMPRITRAQSMDVLSSQATIQGYKAVILAAAHLPRMFPMMMTAAGTVAPAKVFVIGAGVAGLQAIATARRNGAIVTGYDIRPVVRGQVESLGATFLEIAIEAEGAEDKGGYAKAMDDTFYERQQEAMTEAVAHSDVVITTAAVPGRKSPVLVTEAMVDGMAPGSVIVDLAAERGGNCELTRADEEVVHKGVTILGPSNIAATVPFHASQMYAKNIVTFLHHLVKEGRIEMDMEDEITEQTLLTSDGAIVQRRVRGILKLDGEVAPEPAAETPAESGSEG
jgi:NAD(P) transhydrogenase subunit alpha